MTIRLEYDKEADAAYIYLNHPIRYAEVRETLELNDDIRLDFDNSGLCKLIGIEILNASNTLRKKLLSKAIPI